MCVSKDDDSNSYSNSSVYLHLDIVFTLYYTCRNKITNKRRKEGFGRSVATAILG